MNFFKEHKGMSILLSLTVIVFLGYFFFPSGSGNIIGESVRSGIIDPQKNIGNISGVGVKEDDIATIFQKIKLASIDTSLFYSELWGTLVDIPRSISKDIPGKTNPFSPIGVGGSQVVATTTQR